jgi:hypothetical protein
MTRGHAISGWTHPTAMRPDVAALDATTPAAPGNPDGEAAVDAFLRLARDPSRTGLSGEFLDLRWDEDWTARGTGSAFERLALRLGADNVGTNDQRAALELIGVFATADSAEFARAAMRRLGVTAEQADDLAGLGADLAAAAAQMEVVREARGAYAACAEQVDALRDRPADRDAFLRRLATAEPEAVDRMLAELGADDLARTLVTGIVQSLGSIAGGDPAAVEVPAELDEWLLGRLEATRDGIAAAADALAGAGVATSPVNVFRDFGPLVERVLQRCAPGLDGPETFESSLLSEGMERAAADHESTAFAVELLKTAARLCLAFAAGPAGPVLAGALVAADVTWDGTNHARIDAQRMAGASDGAATSFLTTQESLRAGTLGPATEGVGHVLAGRAGGVLGAILGEAETAAYRKLAEALSAGE